MIKEDTKTPVQTEEKASEAQSSTSTLVDSAVTPEQAAEAEVKIAKKRKTKRAVPQGQIHIHASFNNTIVTITDPKGGAIVSASCGSSGFKGAKKGTAYAAQVAIEKAVTAAKQQFGFNKAEVFIKGIGMGRESAIRQLANSGITIERLIDVTGSPHGGTRRPRTRRV